MNHDLRSLVKKMLLDTFPGMIFGIELTNPKNKYTNNYQTIHITYNDEIARERGITQKSMRDALAPVTSSETFRYGTQEYYTEPLSKVSFTKRTPPRPAANPERVAEAVRDLTAILNATDNSSVQTVEQTLDILKQYVPRAQHAFFNAVREGLSDTAVSE
jgi:hypothetical protein